MKQIRVLALSEPENTGRLQEILECESFNRMASLRPHRANLERAVSLPVDAAVLLAPVLTADAAHFAGQLYMQRSDIALLLLCETADTEALSRAMDCGIGRVLTLNTPPEEIRRAVEQEIARVRGRQNTTRVQDYDSRVISTFSSKGGCGKTTLAVNFAVALQKAGKKVAVVDLNLAFGDVGTFLNLPHCDTISDLIAEGKITASTVESFLFRHGSGVQVLCAPPSPEYAELIKPEHVERLATVLRADFDYVIFDLAPSLDEVVLTALDMSDAVYMLTNPEIATLRDTRICLNVFRTLDHARKVRLVLNRAGDSYISEKDVETALELKPELVLPADRKSAISAVNRGIPVVTAYPKSKLSKALQAYVKKGGV